MNRIWIRGTSGSGKTTLGRALGAKLGIDAVDLDDLYWLPGWKNRSREEFRSRVEEVLARPRWIVMGNYTRVAPDIEAVADTMIWLDYPLPVTFARIVRRTVRRVVTGERCCNGNRESFRKSFFAKESVIWWCLTTHAKRHREAVAFIAKAPPDQIRLCHRSPGEAAAWLRDLAGSGDRDSGPSNPL